MNARMNAISDRTCVCARGGELILPLAGTEREQTEAQSNVASLRRLVASIIQGEQLEEAMLNALPAIFAT